jgi:hypothetical protein
LLQITFLSPETFTHKIAIFQTQQTAPLLPLPEINFNLPRRICVTRDQPRPGSFLKKREEPGNEVVNELVLKLQCMLIVLTQERKYETKTFNKNFAGNVTLHKP